MIVDKPGASRAPMLGLAVALAVNCFAVSSARAQSDDQSKAQAEYEQKVRALHWVMGPKSVSAIGNATLQLPDGFYFLPPDDTQKFELLNENPTDGVEEELFAPPSFQWYAVISFSPDGYVKDDEKIDADAVLASIKEGTAAANVERRKQGWGELEIVGWRRAPYYDDTTKRLEWALNVRSAAGEAVNFSTKILGRRGVTSAVMVGSPETFDADVAEFKKELTLYSFNPGDKYAEFKPGDKVASYGLTALIAGGAAVAATKLGLWKWLGAFLVATWKFIWIPIAAAGVGIRRAVKRIFGGNTRNIG